jgi:hypothetical protein
MARRIPIYYRLSNNGARLYERVTGVLRLALLIVPALFFAALCLHRLEGVDVWTQALQLRQNALFPEIPTEIWVLLVPLQSWEYARYLMAPLSAFLFVFVGSALYVRDIYHLPRLRGAFRYVTASLFGFFYPVIHVDGGRLDDEDPDDEANLEDRHLLRAIGGPGFVKIQPGNAVAFRDWWEPRGVAGSGLYFMRPFEMIARVVNLEDQHGHIDDVRAVTRDGIRLRLKNIDYRFCVRSPVQERHFVQRDPGRPYPFSLQAIHAIAYSFAVTDRGQDRWHDVVSRSMSGALGTFISEHELDYLTAPRKNGQDPRGTLRVELFKEGVRESLRRVGAELHWMDIGHFDIDEMGENKEQHPVDQTRARLWATRPVGDAKTIRSYGEARHMVYQELARAEAQAEMIMSITESLRSVSFGPDKAESLRQIFLAKTAQILEALQDKAHPGRLPS